MELSGNLRHSKERKITQAQARQLDAWEKFLHLHNGVYPASLAASKLRMTTSGVFQAADRGWIAFFKIGRDRWYSRRDVIRYRSEVSMRFPSNRPLPSSGPKNFFPSMQDETSLYSD